MLALTRVVGGNLIKITINIDSKYPNWLKKQLIM